MTSPSFKTCPAGHYYAASLPACPYCADSGTAGFTPPAGNGGDDDKTRLTGNQGTETFVPPATGNETVKVNVPPPAFNRPPDDNDRTMIRPPATSGPDHSVLAGGEKERARQTRKLTGWLVSFSVDPMGVDYRLYEGQNPVGRDITCSVRIISDGSISSRHATILFRNGHFYLRDEMATNPSFINGEELPPGATLEVKDGDRLRFGATECLLRTAY